ncbi:Cyclin-dependent kinase 10 [Aphelenchoides besseyi]|nr:Cyclin-dependent kinase 10 [Aphelenchoides besseyi]
MTSIAEDDLIKVTSIVSLESTKIPLSSIGYGACRSVDEYEKIRLCGEGSYGVVWKGREKSTGNEYALKKLRLRLDEEVNVSVMREIYALKSLQHENIVRLVDVAVGKKMHKIFLVMEYCDADLAYMLNQMNVPFTESQVKCLLLQLFEGLDYMHRRFYVHRDIKLSNLLMNAYGILKIGDFGLSRLFGRPSMAMTPQVVTLWYRAPELLLGSAFQDTGIDMWAAGCIMAELLLHKPFLPGDSEIDQVLVERPGMSKLKFPEGFSLINQPFNNLKQRFTNHSAECLDMLYQLFCYDPKRRATAEACIAHRYFDVTPLPCSPDLMPSFRTLLKPKKTNE